jgi:hypothetical protein
MDLSTLRGQRERTTGSLEFGSNASQPILVTSDQDDEVKSLDPAERLLCARCAAVDFDGALLSELEDILIGDMGSIKEWSIDSSSFCKLVGSISTNDNGIQYECSLRTVNSSKHKANLDLAFIRALSPRLLLGIYHKDIPIDYFSPQVDSIGTVRSLKVGSIDYSVFNSWLDLCKTAHTKECTSALRGQAPVQHLKFIDCYTRQVVPAKNVAYVALSYIWGQTGQGIEFSEQLPINLPSTIEDALKVTQIWGYNNYGSTAILSTNRIKHMHIHR